MLPYDELIAIADAELWRGSGLWPTQSYPCELEPPCDWSPEQETYWSRYYRSEGRADIKLRAVEWSNDSDQLVSITVSQFNEDETTILKAEQLLRSLSHVTRPASFELHGYGGDTHTPGASQIKFVAHEADAATLDHQLQTHYPNSAVLVESLGVADMALCHTLHNYGGYCVSLTLDASYLQPLATVTNLATDPLAVVISALDHLDEGSRAMVQILFTPANQLWARTLKQAVANPFLKGGPYVFTDVTDTDFATKFASPLFAVSVRLAAETEQDQTHLLAWADQYAAPPQRLATNDNESLLLTLPNAIGSRTTYRPGFILNCSELAGLIHLPAHTVHSERLQRITTRTRPAPHTTPEPGSITLGTNTHRGRDTPARIPAQLRPRHCYISGASGTGKSTLILNLIKQDIDAGHGVGVLDPHGDLIDHTLAIIPKSRINDVVYFNPSDIDHPPAFNILQTVNHNERERSATEAVSTIRKFYPKSWGVRMDHILIHTFLTVMKARTATLLDVRRMLSEDAFRNHVVAQLTDDALLSFWHNEFPQYPKNVCDPIMNKLSPFLLNTTIRNIICQRQSKFNFDQIINSKKIFLANLSTGLLGESVAGIFGTFIMSKIINAAFRRAAIPEPQRVPFYLYVDEMQNFMDLTIGFEKILAEARKYRLVLAAMANQYVSQLTDEVKQAIFGNVGTLLTFRLGVQDARLVANEFGEFTPEEILSLEMGQALCRVGGTQTAFNLTTPPPPKPNPPALVEKILATARTKYATPRSQVEQLFVTKRAAPTADPKSQATVPVATKQPRSSPQRPQQAASKPPEHINPNLIDDDLV